MSVLFSRSQGSALIVKMSSVSHWGRPGEVLPSLQYGGSWSILCLRPVCLHLDSGEGSVISHWPGS